MKLGFSYWGFCETFENSKEAKTPDGHRFGRPIFVDAMVRAGHQVIALQNKRETILYPDISYNSSLPDVDVLFVEWRWPTYKNSGSKKIEPDLDRQNEILEHYHGKVPIVIWDCDYKVTADDEMRWPLAIIADPALNPRQLTRPRQRLMFWSDWNTLLKPSAGSFEYGYVGNNYERPDAFERYYSAPSQQLRKAGIQTTVHGNWLEISPERENPSYLIQKHPHIAFGPRLNFYGSLARLNSFICTTHITKPEYAQRGFVSPRYLENIAAGVPALVPEEFVYPGILGEQWIVRSSQDVVDKIKMISSLSLPDRESVVKQQEASLKSQGVFSVNEVVSFLESLKRG